MDISSKILFVYLVNFNAILVLFQLKIALPAKEIEVKEIILKLNLIALVNLDFLTTENLITAPLVN